MPARHRSRQRALQVMFLWDLRRQPIQEAISAYYETLSSEEDDPQPIPPDPFMEILVRGASSAAPEIDLRIASKSEHWRLERMPVVDRNILRLAVFEMKEAGTPAPVVIDEALELARQFSGGESVAFINGVLDAVHRDTPHHDTPQADAAHGNDHGHDGG
jgi:N utilization substance protein B